MTLMRFDPFRELDRSAGATWRKLRRGEIHRRRDDRA